MLAQTCVVHLFGGPAGHCAGQAMAAGPEPLVYYPFDQLDGIVLDASATVLTAHQRGVQLVPGGYATAATHSMEATATSSWSASAGQFHAAA